METESDWLWASGRPSEIFICIFQLAISSSRSQTRTAIHLAGVSKGWRDVILSAAELWESIDCTHPLLMKLSIKRAGTRTLSFSFSTNSRRYMSRMSTILLQIHRVKSLDLRYGEKGKLHDKGHIEEWTVPAITLETLSLSSFSLPPNFLAGRTPVLQELALNACNFDWDNLPRFPQLRHLSIQHPTEGTDTATFSAILESSPHLKSITLSDVFNESSDRIGVVSLMELESFSSTNDYSYHVIALIEQIAFPQTARIFIDLQEEEDPSDFGEIFELLKASPLDPAWEAQNITIVADTGIPFYLFQCSSNLESRSVDVTIRDCMPDINQNFAYINLLRLKSLDLNGRGVFPPSFWNMFSNLSELRTLKVRNVFAPDSFLKFVRDQENTKADSGRLLLSFSYIQDLLFEQYDLEPEKFNASLLQLSEYLRFRYGLGFGVTNLTVVGSNRMLGETENVLLESVQDLQHMTRGDRYSPEKPFD
ncbi:hypothetical protein BDN72DRAFT_260625 [Pluteus cervinus]|uniref:Uncharacterized protein n=1 Tax=Pluteus cervinus TaxID=181527 RepID=A0ACD3AFQ8_9AGAR|nr:hypothetical protein BDN72DRAFT_260625 [Pluteus cervinus]